MLKYDVIAMGSTIWYKRETLNISRTWLRQRHWAVQWPNGHRRSLRDRRTCLNVTCRPILELQEDDWPIMRDVDENIIPNDYDS